MDPSESALNPTPAPARRKLQLAPYNPSSSVVQPRDIQAAIGLSAVTVWRLRRAGLFPQPIRLSPGRVGWRRSDLDAWLAERQASGHTLTERYREAKG